MLSDHVSKMINIWTPTRDLEDTLKIYSLRNEQHSAVFAVIDLGNSMKMISVYGNFDHAKLGESTNIPPELSDVASKTNTSLQQCLAYKNDAAGASYFSRAGSPPPCDKFNYSVMVLSLEADNFGIKSSSYKVGDEDVYKFKISELKPMTLQSLQSPREWCKPKTEVTKALNANDSGFAIGFLWTLAAIVFGLILYNSWTRRQMPLLD